MRAWLTGFVMVLSVTIAALETSGAQDKKKDPPKKNPAFTDAKEAGPDFQIQGEYEGSMDENRRLTKLGAQVIARGDGKFEVYFLPGGLPGAGWDGVTKRMFPAQAEQVGGKTVVKIQIKGGSATIRDEKLIGFEKGESDISYSLGRVVRKSPTLGAKPPQGAVVLFDGKNADEWERGKLVEKDLLSPLAPGNIVSKKTFKDFKLHLEFRTPFMPYSTGQARGNSGIYLQDRYELQVLDSFGLKGVNNECGGFYQQADPKVNMCYPPLSWQTYDIDFRAARFDAAGKKTDNAVVTVKHNGVIIHEDLELKKETPGGKKETDTGGPLQLQNHGNPVYYGNIWVLEVKEEKK